MSTDEYVPSEDELDSWMTRDRALESVTPPSA